MYSVRLVEIVEANFRKSELTNFNSLPVTRRTSLHPGDAICFVSRTGNQLVFVHKPIQLASGRKSGARDVVYSTRLRLTQGTWEPTMLANYAASVGLTLVGLKRFEQYHSQRS